jgi:GH25 family lysozyme M1 (1,4-beta-N-acetylmuramidase)
LVYYQAWLAGILKDGHYKPGIYAAKSNAATLRAAALNVYKAAGSTADPPFWIASSAGFSIAQAPSAVGLDYAKLWQGGYDLTQTFGGITLFVDANVAAVRSPSAP